MPIAIWVIQCILNLMIKTYDIYSYDFPGLLLPVKQRRERERRLKTSLSSYNTSEEKALNWICNVYTAFTSAVDL